MSQKPKMSDVARLAGVGTMTVSRFLNRTAPVSPETARRVEKAIEQLRYRPNELARVFRGQRTKSIGLILPYLYDPFFATCAHAITTAAKERGYSVTIMTSDERSETEYGEVEEMLQKSVEGFLIIPAQDADSRLNRSLFGKTPVVVFDRPVAEPSFDSVLVQNSAGARRMVEHLIGHGHKRISFMGLSRKLFTIDARFAGYRRAVQHAGLPNDAFFGSDSPDEMVRAVSDRLHGKNASTAFFASNNLSTRSLVSALLHLGVKVPGEIAVGGFDDSELAELMSPPLTVVRQPASEMGRVAANLLFDRIARNESQRAGQKIVLPVELVLRRSCGCQNRGTVVVQ